MPRFRILHPANLFMFGLFLAIGCGKNSGGGEEPDTGTRSQPEGAFPGECDDGADNDFDGDYDCNDADCEGAPDCSENCDDGDCTDSGTSYPAVVDVQAGGGYACLIFDSGAVQCKGNNSFGESEPPSRLFDTIALHGPWGDRSCGVTTTGTIECWGAEFSEYFDGAPFGGTPLAGTAFVEVAHSRWMLCGLDAGGLVDCITSSYFGEMDYSVPSNTSFSDIDVAGFFGCGITDTKSLECWGPERSDAHDILIPPNGSYTQVELGNEGVFGCALRTDGFVECWGHSSNYTEAPPIQFESISVGYQHSCGVTTDQTVTCWGSNNSTESNAPLYQQFQSVSAGENFSCGLTIDGNVECWGAGAFFF